MGYEIRAGAFYWTGASNLTAGQILAFSDGEDSHTQKQNAEEFLKLTLADGPRPSKELLKEAREVGLSSATLYRAKESLNIKAKKEGKPGDKDQRWVWRLPEGEDNHEDYQIEIDDNLRTSNGNKEFDTEHLAEDNQENASDSLRSPVDNLRADSERIACYSCKSTGIRFSHCNKCGEFLR